MEFLGIPVEHWKEVGYALAFLAGSAIVGRLVLFVLDRYVSRLTKRTPTSFDDALMDAARMPLFWAIVFAGLALALNQLSFLPADWRDKQAQWMFVPYWLVAWVLIHRLVGNLLDWYGQEMARRTHSPIDEEVVPFARRLILVLVAAVAIIVLLSHFGVDVTALVTSLGIASLAIALAAQNTLSDWITGFVIILDRPFKIGDRIELLALDTWGDVQDIGLQSTRVRTRDNRMVVVPNSVIGKNLVVNHSDPSTVYRTMPSIKPRPWPNSSERDCVRRTTPA